MKIFIFEDVKQVSRNYHPNGGLVVIAEDEWQVNQLVEDDEYCIDLTERDWANVTVHELTYDVEPDVFVFPDAGCC